MKPRQLRDRYTAWCVRQSLTVNCGHRVAIPAVALVVIAVVCRIYWAVVEKVLIGLLVAICVALAVLIGLGIRRLSRHLTLVRDSQARAASERAASAVRERQEDSLPRWPDRPLRTERERTADGPDGGRAGQAAAGQSASGQGRADAPPPAAPDNQVPGQDPMWDEFLAAHPERAQERG